MFDGSKVLGGRNFSILWRVAVRTALCSSMDPAVDQTFS